MLTNWMGQWRSSGSALFVTMFREEQWWTAGLNEDTVIAVAMDSGHFDGELNDFQEVFLELQSVGCLSIPNWQHRRKLL